MYTSNPVGYTQGQYQTYALPAPYTQSASIPYSHGSYASDYSSVEELKTVTMEWNTIKDTFGSYVLEFRSMFAQIQRMHQEMKDPALKFRELELNRNALAKQLDETIKRARDDEEASKGKIVTLTRKAAEERKSFEKKLSDMMAKADEDRKEFKALLSKDRKKFSKFLEKTRSEPPPWAASIISQSSAQASTISSLPTPVQAAPPSGPLCPISSLSGFPGVEGGIPLKELYDAHWKLDLRVRKIEDISARMEHSCKKIEDSERIIDDERDHWNGERDKWKTEMKQLKDRRDEDIREDGKLWGRMSYFQHKMEADYGFYRDSEDKREEEFRDIRRVAGQTLAALQEYGKASSDAKALATSLQTELSSSKRGRRKQKCEIANIVESLRSTVDMKQLSEASNDVIGQISELRGRLCRLEEKEIAILRKEGVRAKDHDDMSTWKLLPERKVIRSLESAVLPPSVKKETDKFPPVSTPPVPSMEKKAIPIAISLPSSPDGTVVISVSPLSSSVPQATLRPPTTFTDQKQIEKTISETLQRIRAALAYSLLEDGRTDLSGGRRDIHEIERDLNIKCEGVNQRRKMFIEVATHILIQCKIDKGNMRRYIPMSEWEPLSSAMIISVLIKLNTVYGFMFAMEGSTVVFR